MDNQPSFDPSLRVPALIGVFSVLGIIIVLFIGRLTALRAPVSVTETQTPFKYIYLGTEPGISTEPLPEESATATPAEEPPPAPTENLPVILTPILLTPDLPLPTTLSTPTSASTPPLNAGTYDDIDYRLVYSGEWTNQTDVSGAYQGTLHVSNIITTPGNSVVFRYIGLDARLFFQTGASLGVVQITLDGKQSELDQSNTSNEWLITADKVGTHTVTITHVRGGSVNLDFVIIPLGITPSPSPTSTGTN